MICLLVTCIFVFLSFSSIYLNILKLFWVFYYSVIENIFACVNFLVLELFLSDKSLHVGFLVEGNYFPYSS